ncbi:hypothetical protein TSUD_06650, partial [Trifolium subterraneum]
MMSLSWSLVSIANKKQQQFRRFKITIHRLFGFAFLCSISFFLFSPKIPRSPNYHQFADLRNLLGVPNTMMVAYSSLFSSLVIERIGQRIGLGCMCALLFAAFTCGVYERIYDDIRLCLMFQLILPLAIAVVAYMYPSNYTHSTYWFSSIGIYLLAKLEAVSDKKLYRANNYVISGHSLEHLCLALIPFSLSVMLICRERKFK